MPNVSPGENPQNQMDELDQDAPDVSDGFFIQLARDAFSTSDDYLEGSLKNQWERNMAMFRVKHPPGSKYGLESYKYRSKIARPRMRSGIKRHEAAAAVAFFSTKDVTMVEAINQADKNQIVASKLIHNLIEYRLENTIPWFMTVIGAYQEAMNMGVVVSKQYWKYKERVETIKSEMGEDVEQPIILQDEPCVELFPIENIRLDPGCDWTDPINTSPYVIALLPMYITDVKARMEEVDQKTGQPKWKKYSDAEIMSATKHEYDSLRQRREGSERRDSKEPGNVRFKEHDIIWIHENMIKAHGVDWVYWTIGTEFLLTEPVPVTDVYKQGRPFVMGYSQIEAHRSFPSGLPELAEGVNTEYNDLANQRLDNVKLALNMRHYARRGANVDWKNLMRNVPGGVVLMDDINKDVRSEAPKDVTGSGYREQDRVSNEFDEIMGTFSPSSVQSNRQMNETVGGLKLLSQDANSLGEYQLRVFVETWAEPVIKMLADLEREYETDRDILMSAVSQANLQDVNITRQMLKSPIKVRVNVGFGATNPQERVNRLAIGTEAVAKFLPQYMQRANGIEFIKEIFGALGYRDGSRFFVGLENDEVNEMVKGYEEKIQQLTQMLESDQAQHQTKKEVAMITQQGAERREQIKSQTQIEIQQIKERMETLKRRIEAEENDIEKGRLMMQLESLQHQKKVKEVELMQTERDSYVNRITDQRNSMTDVLQNDQYQNIPGSRQ